MYMVVVLRVVLKMEILNSSAITSTNYWVAWFIEIASYCAVNCFAIATGYLMCNHKSKYRKIVPLVLTVFFYSVGITVLYSVLHPEYLNAKVLLKMIPILNGTLWYLIAYFCLFFFIPYINILLEKLNRRQFAILLISGFFLLSVTNVIAASPDLMATSSGYSVWWLMYCYLVGAWIKKYNFDKGISALKCLMGYVLSVVVTFVYKGVVEFCIHKSVPGFSTLFTIFGADRFVSYISPTILASGVFLVLFCLNVKIPKFLHKPLKFTAPLIFQVYVIHLHPIIWGWLNGRFTHYTSKSPVMMILSVLAAALVIFALCLFIDYIRLLLFKFLKVNDMIDKISDAVAQKMQKSKLNQIIK